MHQVHPAGLEVGAGFSAANHVHDFKLEPVGFIESCILRHPDSEEGICRSSLADPEGNKLGVSTIAAVTCQSQERGHDRDDDGHSFRPHYVLRRVNRTDFMRAR